MSALSLRYAHALASVVKAQNLDATAAQQQLKDFGGALATSRELREVLANPSIPSQQKLNVLDAIAGRLGMFRQVRNFVAVVIDHGRLAEFSEMVADFATVSDEQLGLAEAEITSAYPLNDSDKAELEAQVAKLAGGRVRATYREDKSLLGGAVVKIGSTVYDGSIRAQLTELKQRLVGA
jgi:F-type H+-transporting ATPase subunit delta